MHWFELNENAILNEKASKGLPDNIGDLVTVVRYRDKSNYDYEIELPSGDTAFVKESELNKLTDKQKELITYIYKGNRVIYIPSNEKVTITKVDFIHNQVAIKFDDYGAIVVGFESLKKLDEEIDSVVEFKFKVGDKVKTSMNYAFNGISGAVGVIEKCTNADYGITCYVSFDRHNAYAIPEQELELIETEPTEQSGRFTQIGLEIGKFTDMKNKQYGSSVDATNEMMKVLMERYTYDEENYLMPKSLLQHILLQVRIMDKQNRIFNNPSGEGDSESPYNDITGYGIIGVDMVSK